MPRALRPATPEGEIAARGSWRGSTLAGDVLTADIVAFCESGVSVTAAAVAPPRRPIAVQGLGCRISADGVVRLLLRRPACVPLLEAVEAGSGIAATMSRPHDHRSIQLKGATARIDRATTAEVEATRQQARAFADDLVAVGYPPDFATTYVAFEPGEILALEFVPNAAFVQTPGPAAGTALTP